MSSATAEAADGGGVQWERSWAKALFDWFKPGIRPSVIYCFYIAIAALLLFCVPALISLLGLWSIHVFVFWFLAVGLLVSTTLCVLFVLLLSLRLRRRGF